MDRMDEQKALEMLELNPDATKEDVSKRYGMLARKYRNLKRDENGYTIEDITQAYNLLMGINYVDPKEEERQRQLREHPPLLARILKKDPIKLENFFHYYKVHIMILLAVIVIAFFSVRSCVNQVPTDFCLVLYGNVFTDEPDSIELSIQERMPELTAPAVHGLHNAAEDPQYQYAVEMKFVAMLAAHEIDVVLMDAETFKKVAYQGVLLPLDDKMKSLGFPADKYAQGVEILEETEEGEPVYGPLKTYGVDITGSDFLKENGIIVKEAVAAVVINSGRIEQAVSFLEKLNEN